MVNFKVKTATLFPCLYFVLYSVIPVVYLLGGEKKGDIYLLNFKVKNTIELIILRGMGFGIPHKSL